MAAKTSEKSSSLKHRSILTSGRIPESSLGATPRTRLPQIYDLSYTRQKGWYDISE